MCDKVLASVRDLKHHWPPLTRFQTIPVSVALPRTDSSTSSSSSDSSDSTSIDTTSEPVRFTPLNGQVFEASSDVLPTKPILFCCPGLNGDHLEGFQPHVRLMNKTHRIAYGPTGLTSESQSGYYNNLAYYPSETLHDLMLLLKDPAMVTAWNKLTLGQCSHSDIAAMPSFFHLPSDAVVISIALLLALFSPSPAIAVKNLLGHSSPCTFSGEALAVNVVGFSAGSYTGMVVYRVLVEHGPLLHLRFQDGILGGITFHPIMFYDFCLHQGLPPLDSHLTFRASTAAQLPRIRLLQLVGDKLTPWNPSSDEAQGVRSLNYPLILLTIPRDSPLFGHSSHSYSHLLAPVLTNRTSDLTYVKLHELVDVSSPSDKLFVLLLALLASFGTKAFTSFIESLVLNSPLLSQETAKLWEQRMSSPAQVFWESLLQVDYKGLLLEHLKPSFDALMTPIEWRTQAWLLFFAVPCSFARHVQATSDRRSTGTMSVKYKCVNAVVPTSCHVTSVIGHSAAQLVLSFRCSAETAGWADFLVMQRDGSILRPAKGKGKTKQPGKGEYSNLGFRIGDLVKFKLVFPHTHVWLLSLLRQSFSHPVRSVAEQRVSPRSAP